MTFPTTHPALARALAAKNYAVPTSVQLAVLEDRAAGKDLLVSAQTGSGKTVAFGLAMATAVLGTDEKFGRAAEPLALIIAPTRELALQVQRELVWLYAEAGAKVITCVGGMDPKVEGRNLGFGAHIVVGTPGRLRDHIERRRLDLTKLKAIVLDEADEMLDLGFREDLEFILEKTPEDKQTLLFSATMPRDIENMAKRYQRDAVRIETVNKHEQHADIDYRAMRVSPSDVENAVVNTLRFHEARATLVFCSTREGVKRTHARLVERGFSAVALSGELTQHERTTALTSLRDGRARVLVATDVAARGLDLPDLALVIHADLPNDRETLLHRSGRTGRAGKKGMCVLIVPFNRRRKADMLLSAARLRVTWGNPPTADEIRAKDQERFMADPIFTEAPTDADLALAKILQSGRTADEIALALVRIHKTRLPEPEDIAEDTGPPKRDDRGRNDRFAAPRGADRDGPPRGRVERFERNDRGGDRSERFNDGPRATRAPREDGREMVWFRLNIGRERNADPKWILPLICKAGGVNKSDIGSIKIHDRDTRFQIVAENADAFAEAVRTNKNKEGQISRVTDAHQTVVSTPDDATVTAAIDQLAKPHTPKPHVPRERPARSDDAPTERSPRESRYEARKEPRQESRHESRHEPRQDAPREARPESRYDSTNRDDRGAKPFADKKPGSKAPWRDRGKPGYEPKPRTFADKKPYDRDRGPPKGNAGPAGASRPSSKFAHKKKNRQPNSAGA